MHPSIPQYIQDLAAAKTVEHPDFHIGIINTVFNWHVTGTDNDEALQDEFHRLCAVDGVHPVAAVMWSHPPMVQS